MLGSWEDFEVIRIKSGSNGFSMVVGVMGDSVNATYTLMGDSVNAVNATYTLI